MPDRDTWLRPGPIEGITWDAERGVPVVRDTGLSATDVSLEMGPDGLSDEQTLERHPTLLLSDLAAVREYASARPLIDSLVDAVLVESPSHDTVLDAYLLLPRIVLSHHEHPHLGVPMKVRSSFEAVYEDASHCRGAWLKAIGHLGLLDQLGTALERTDRSSMCTTSLERALDIFSDVEGLEGAALYALRCSLAHDFSLVNFHDGKRQVELQHAFVLHTDDATPLVALPDAAWDGDPTRVEETHVHLDLLAVLIDEVRQSIFECYDRGVLKLALAPEEARRRYIFTHPVDDSEWRAQQNNDEAARWGFDVEHE